MYASNIRNNQVVLTYLGTHTYTNNFFKETMDLKENNSGTHRGCWKEEMKGEMVPLYYNFNKMKL